MSTNRPTKPVDTPPDETPVDPNAPRPRPRPTSDPEPPPPPPNPGDVPGPGKTG